jgi:hypothetical protein
MANQKKSQQAKKIEAMGAKVGATKSQVAQGLARAGGKSSYNVTNKDVKKAGQAAKIIAGAAVTAAGPGKVVKAAKAAKAVAAAKTATKAKETAKTVKIASNSVKVKPANTTNPSNQRLNISSSSILRQIKSGKIAKNQAHGVEFSNAILNAMKNTKPKVIKINSNKK